jgi:hypothetical protein
MNPFIPGRSYPSRVFKYCAFSVYEICSKTSDKQVCRLFPPDFMGAEQFLYGGSLVNRRIQVKIGTVQNEKMC